MRASDDIPERGSEAPVNARNLGRRPEYWIGRTRISDGMRRTLASRTYSGVHEDRPRSWHTTVANP